MSSPRFERLLARLYAEPAFAERFLASPDETLRELDLNAHERQAALKIDRAGLLMAVRSFAAKRRERFT